MFYTYVYLVPVVKAVAMSIIEVPGPSTILVVVSSIRVGSVVVTLLKFIIFFKLNTSLSHLAVGSLVSYLSRHRGVKQL